MLVLPAIPIALGSICRRIAPEESPAPCERRPFMARSLLDSCLEERWDEALRLIEAGPDLSSNPLPDDHRGNAF